MKALLTFATLATTCLAWTTKYTKYGEGDPVECETDTDCSYRCCNYAQEFKLPGECVEIDEEPRCETRKRNHRISLGVILFITIAAWSILVWLKKKETRNNKERLAHLKVVKAREEASQVNNRGRMLASSDPKGHRKNQSAQGPLLPSLTPKGQASQAMA